MTPLTRRSLIAGLTALAALGLVPQALAATPVKVGDRALGAIVAAVGGKLVTVTVDEKMATGMIAIGGSSPVDVTSRVLFKGKGRAHRRFLDDARNAPKVSANIRKRLADADPANTKRYEDSQRAWSRAFARKVLAWQQRLHTAKLSGKAMRDPHGRIYLLEWAGGKIDPKAKSAGPAGLAKLPAEPTAATPAAYETYVTKLVASIAP